MTLPRRQIVLAAALAATLAATAWVATQPDGEPDATVAAVAPRRVAAHLPTAAATAASAAVAQAPGARQPWADVDAAQLAAWQPPPPPPPPPEPTQVIAAAPPPPPVAPPAPFQMIGRLVEGEGAQAVELALLTGPSRTLSVKRGDVIDGQWRVEQVSSGGVSLTWLPSQLPQNIVFKAVP